MPNLDDSPAALGTKVWQRDPYELDRPEQVGRDDVLDLLVGEFFRSSEEAVASVAHNHVDASKLSKRAFDDLSHRRRVGDIEHLDTERVGSARDEIGDLRRVANRSHDAVASYEELLGKMAAESAAHASDKPGALCHFPFSCHCWCCSYAKILLTAR